MAEHTPGPWAIKAAIQSPDKDYAIMKDHSIIADVFEHIGPNYERHIADAEANAHLIAAAPTAPHDCDVPGCPGAENRHRLDAFDGMRTALEVILNNYWHEPACPAFRGAQEDCACWRGAVLAVLNKAWKEAR